MASKTSKGQEAYYARYKAQNLWQKNRKKRLEAILAKNPDNEQVREALSNLKYRRKKPASSVWSSTKRKTAEVLKYWTGNFDPNILSSNQVVASAALQGLKTNSRDLPKSVLDSIQARAMFSIQARANIGQAT